MLGSWYVAGGLSAVAYEFGRQGGSNSHRHVTPGEDNSIVPTQLGARPFSQDKNSGISILNKKGPFPPNRRHGRFQFHRLPGANLTRPAHEFPRREANSLLTLSDK
jgi:hypothetical protein